ncbi:hypothetical protein AAFF_G00414050 [Aldrovandia affinis]|uniref:Uncharacterized protein n=1 Tax=Aldrovandia affinis TaxID=143900 RepID=A0AAD7SBP3_9TELE|nr:hypothetical protein AAFF_G00414050 [Aldrovandia affinis]
MKSQEHRGAVAATEPVEDRLNLFPVKAESFAEDSDPQRGLTISKQRVVGSAAAEISQVINESTAEWSLELSRSKKENDALKRELVQIESELQAARGDGKRRAGPRESGVEMCSVGVQVRDEIPGAERSGCEEEPSLTIDGVFGKDWISLWRDGGLTAVTQEATPLQPVSKEEATEPVEDRLNLFPVKAESFAENSDPQRGLTISKQRVVGSAAAGERPSIEHQYCEEESDPLHTPAGGLEEQHTQSTPAEGLEEQHTQSTPAEGLEEQHTQSTPAEGLEEQHTQSTPAEGLEEQHTQSTPVEVAEEPPGPPLSMTELNSETDAHRHFHHGESVDAAKNIKTNRQVTKRKSYNNKVSLSHHKRAHKEKHLQKKKKNSAVQSVGRVSIIKAISFGTNVFTQEKNHTAAQSVGRTSTANGVVRSISAFTQEKNHTAVQSVGRASTENRLVRSISAFTQEKNHTAVQTVGRASTENRLVRSISAFTQEKNHTAVQSVGKVSL